METISPGPKSVSPPGTQTLGGDPHAYVLPPLKTLPTWNRTKFKNGNVRPVSKDKSPTFKVELIGHIEQVENNSTQTSPISFGEGDNKAGGLNDISEDENLLKQSYERKIVFLERTHKDMLAGLHRELDVAKNQNKSLQFQVVLSQEKEPRSQHENEAVECRRCEDARGENKEQVDSLRLENRQLKKQVNDLDSKNTFLLKLVEQVRFESSLKPVENPVKSKPRQLSSKKLKKSKSSHTKMPNECADSGEVDRPHSSTEVVKENATRQTVVLPKIPKAVTTLGTTTSQKTTSNQNSVQPQHKKKGDTPALPVINSLPMTGHQSFSMREKRAKQLHVIRQRSNKDVCLRSEN